MKFSRISSRLVAVASLVNAIAHPASAGIVINEIHYNPDVKTEPAEFIELYNTGPQAINLLGWRFSNGLDFTFPATNVVPGGFVVVAQNPAFLQSKFAATGALGPIRPDGYSSLGGRGDTITLRDAAGAIVDEVSYGAAFPWPIVGDATTVGAGKSIELIHPGLDNDLGSSWRPSGSGSGGTPAQNITLVPALASWKFVRGTNEASTPVTSWRQPAFNDSSWEQASLPLGYGETFIVTPLPDMSGGYTSVFLRKQFTIDNPAQFNSLLLEAQYDDGFKAWINGVLVIDGSANMTAGEVPFSGTAVAALENLNYVAFNLAGLPGSLLVPGVNTLAVQAHNSSLAGSSDFFFDARLIGQIGATGGSGPTPGRVNTVFATNAPPSVRQVDHTPRQPVSGSPVTITAKVTDPQGVGSVSLAYQIVNPGQYIELTDAAYTNAANWIVVAMNDAGINGDATPNDDTFSAQIPASVQQHRRLVRYRLTVTDRLGKSATVPYAEDAQPNFAYFVYDGVPAWRGAVRPGAADALGTVVNYSSNTMGRLPVFHLIGRSNTIATATWFSRYGGDAYQWLGTLVYDGQVLDHIRYRARGGVWRYSMCKNMWKFDLNRGHDLEMRDNWGRKYAVPWSKLNLGASIQQGDFNHRGEQGMFESVGFRLFNLAGVAAPKSTFCTFRVVDEAAEAATTSQFEGDFWGVYLALEQENGRFLEEHDLPDGNLYKMEGGTGELNNVGPFGPTDKSDLNFLQANYTSASEQWWRTNWNLPSHYSYQAIVQGIHHYDIADGKNYFFYRNPQTRLWQTCTWDLDLTWADNMYRGGQTGGDEPLKSRLLDNFASPGRLPTINVEFRNRVREIRDLLWNNDQAYTLIDEYAALLRGPTNAPTILDADRSMWDYNPKMIDAVYSANPTAKAGQGRYYQWPTQTPNPPNLPKTFAGGIQLMKSYVDYRSTNAVFSLDTMARDDARPARPTLTYTGPVELPLNQLTFRCSAYAGANPFRSLRWRLGEITAAPGEPRRYEIEPVWESGDITPFFDTVQIPPQFLRVGNRYRVRVLFTDQTGRNSNWSAPFEFTCGEPLNQPDLIDNLRLTEIMFNPAPGGFEYVELYNASSTLTLQLGGVKFTQGIDYTFAAGASLAPGAYLVLAGTADLSAFRAYYQIPGTVAVYGPYSGSLNNGGEQLVLRTSAGGTDILNFTYGDGRGWPPAADGAGHSLVLAESAVSAENAGSADYPGNWHSSAYLRGSPGHADPPPPAAPLLNEIVAHTDFTAELDSNDWIELYNPAEIPLTLGPGWYLSDDGATYDALKKWAVPATTTIPAHGWVSFDEVTGFHNPTNIGFGLNKAGEQVFLSYLPGTAADRVVDAVSFKAQENDWSLGRYPDGGPDWFALAPRTRNAANAAPSPSIVISEIQFHPQDILVNGVPTDNSVEEFVELQNVAPSPVLLANSNGVWRLNGGVSFDFQGPVTLAADERLIVVNFDPVANPAQLAAFKTRYGVTDPALQIVGPYLGKLANRSDRVALEKPQAPDLPGDAISWIVVDEVLYADQSPWPCGADGTGNSLQRVNASAAGNQPFNWASEPSTPGRGRANLPAGLPTITLQPRGRVAPTNGTATFTVAVCGTPPFAFQWEHNGGPLPGATNATLTLANLREDDAGTYRVSVANAAGSALSDGALLVVQFPPVIAIDPQPVTAIRDQSATFTVSLAGAPPFTYQWRYNGGAIAGATNQTLTLVGVQSSQEGAYSVLVQNSAGSVLSASANLAVLIPATVTTQPTNVAVRLGPVPTNAVFAVVAIGTGTLRYQWLFNDVPIPGATAPQLVITDVQFAHEGVYRVRVQDDIGPTLSDAVTLSILVTPRILVQPVSQIVAAGAPVTLSVSIDGHPAPFSYEWRRSSTPVSTNYSDATTDFYTFPAPTTLGNQNYRVVVRNAASPSGVGSLFATITSVADFDGDGIPDSWEAASGMNTNSAADALQDLDHDGSSNRDEFIAGTDPRDPQSYLRITSASSEANPAPNVRLDFNAVAGRTYTVIGTTNVTQGAWSRVADVVATTNDHPVQVMDPRPPGGPRRFYRLVTPRLQ